MYEKLYSKFMNVLWPKVTIPRPLSIHQFLKLVKQNHAELWHTSLSVRLPAPLWVEMTCKSCNGNWSDSGF